MQFDGLDLKSWLLCYLEKVGEPLLLYSRAYEGIWVTWEMGEKAWVPLALLGHQPNLGPSPARRRIGQTVNILTDEATVGPVLFLAS